MICSTCKCDQHIDCFNKNGFHETGQPRRRTQCKTCQHISQKQNRFKARIEAINAYGGPKCVECGTTDVTQLHINHIHGGGNEHRIELFGRNMGGHKFWIWLKRMGWPEGFDIRCKSCNGRYTKFLREQAA